MLDAIRTPRLVLVPFVPEALRLLIEGDRAGAQQALGGLELPAEFPTQDELAGFLPIQLGRMESAPGRRGWMARLMIANEGRIVGHCGFHGPPEVIGRAEIGYTVFMKYRNQGFAREAAGALVRWAFEQGEQKVFATVSPGNAPSLAVVRRLGFIQVGTQDDEVDGLELVFEIRASQTGAGGAR
jgi:[ribosomal protein S5]-alanine N-acetyltransferase